MSKLKDLTGRTFGKLFAVRRTRGRRDRGDAFWLCKFSCGRNFIARSDRLCSGGRTHCGCMRKTKRYPRRGPKESHGYTGTKTFGVWKSMMNRCYVPSNPSYKNYGGRGIKVCKRWYRFVNFLTDMGNRPHNRTLERRNNDGNYTSRNCCWASRAVQTRNQRRWVGGKLLSAKEWRSLP